MAIKASAGVAFRAPILRIDNTLNAVSLLRDARFDIVALDSGGESALEADYSDRIALVLGNETNGIQKEVLDICERTLSLPLHNDVESLNVAATAAVISYILSSRRGEE